jgi:hypothetical protein
MRVSPAGQMRADLSQQGALWKEHRALDPPQLRIKLLSMPTNLLKQNGYD